MQRFYLSAETITDVWKWFICGHRWGRRLLWLGHPWCITVFHKTSWKISCVRLFHAPYMCSIEPCWGLQEFITNRADQPFWTVGPPVSYCKMKCLRWFVNVLIDLCPQTGESGVVSRRLFSTPRDAFISCCWPALHPHYRTMSPHTLPDCCNNFRRFYLLARPLTARTVRGLNIKCEVLLWTADTAGDSLWGCHVALFCLPAVALLFFWAWITAVAISH